MNLYKIANWSELYENHRSRILKRLLWIPISTQMDGDGYTELLMHPDGIAHFGCWILLLEIAARCDPRGTLMRSNGKPHDPDSIVRVSHANPAVSGDDPAVSGDDPALSSVLTALPGASPPESSAYITLQEEQEVHNITGNARENGAPDLWKVFWQLFVLAGKALGDRDQEKALRLWLNFDALEHQRIILWAVNQAKSVWSSERYTPMPVSALESKGWLRVAAERLIPDPRPKSATDEAFDIVKRGWKS